MNQALNFGYLPEEYSSSDNSSIVIVPVPYDGTSTWIKGADKGPDAIIEASANMELYDIETDSEVYTKGIFTDSPVQGLSFPEEVVETIESIVRYHIEDEKFVVVIGGEHSISIGSVKANAQNHNDLTVLQLDAHSDLRDEYNGSKYSHACVMARIAELCPFLHGFLREKTHGQKKNISRRRYPKRQKLDQKNCPKTIQNHLHNYRPGCLRSFHYAINWNSGARRSVLV